MEIRLEKSSRMSVLVFKCLDRLLDFESFDLMLDAYGVLELTDDAAIDLIDESTSSSSSVNL
jgi:hypothetical protein